jgi:hypothetical protein
MMEGVNSTMINYKKFCKYSNALPAQKKNLFEHSREIQNVGISFLALQVLHMEQKCILLSLKIKIFPVFILGFFSENFYFPFTY